MSGSDGLSAFDRDFLLRWFVHTLSTDHRARLMAEHPVLYNRLVGERVMIVRHRDEAHANPAAPDLVEAWHKEADEAAIQAASATGESVEAQATRAHAAARCDVLRACADQLERALKASPGG